MRDFHCLVGWIEYILVNPENEKLVRLCERMQESLDGYPILNDNAYYTQVSEEACKFWKDLPLKFRIYNCERAGVSILRARFDDLYRASGDNSSLQGYIEDVVQE